MLLAVPVAAAIGVLVRFGLEKYLKSPFYEGQSAAIEEEQDGGGAKIDADIDSVADAGDSGAIKAPGASGTV